MHAAQDIGKIGKFGEDRENTKELDKRRKKKEERLRTLIIQTHVMKHNFRELKIWQDSMHLVKQTYKLLEQVPVDERFGLKSQRGRCAVSLPSNIAEGSGRGTNKDFIRFLEISLGSAYELETQLILLSDLFSIPTEIEIEKCQEIQKMIHGFKTKLIDN